ncbi:MAG: ABC transporter permease [Pseudomonadota bacterium]
MHFLSDSIYKAFLLVFNLDPEVYQIVWTSIYISFWSTTLSSLVGIPLGAIVALKKFRGRPGLILLLNTSMALPTVVIGLLCYVILSRMGPLGDLGLLFTPTGITLGLFILAAPICANLTVAAIQNLDSRVALNCKLLGATPFQQFLLTITEARFAVMAAVVIAFGRVVSEVGIAMMLGGNIKGFTRTMTTAIALETSKGEFELGLALGFVLMCVAFVINGMIFFVQRGKQ